MFCDLHLPEDENIWDEELGREKLTYSKIFDPLAKRTPMGQANSRIYSGKCSAGR